MLTNGQCSQQSQHSQAALSIQLILFPLEVESNIAWHIYNSCTQETYWIVTIDYQYLHRGIVVLRMIITMKTLKEKHQTILINIQTRECHKLENNTVYSIYDNNDQFTGCPK